MFETIAMANKVEKGLPDPVATWWDVSVAKNGVMTLPKDARRQIGLETPCHVLVFAQPEQGRVVLTPLPTPDELLEFASERAVRRSQS